MTDLFSVVKKHIDAWDPFSLLASGCPQDEFDGESRMIAQRITCASSEQEIADIVRRVFSSQFDEASFPEADCLSVAASIKADLLCPNRHTGVL